MLCKYRLIVKGDGHYDSDSILGLLFIMFLHRFSHWRRGDGWVD